MPERISVVVPVYNVAPYLEACLESLARQSMGDLEIVMVDDGSTDASVEIAARFVARDPRFRLVRQANAGLGAARNTGIDHSHGEFLAFVDSDDVLPRHAYEVLLRALEGSGSDFACGAVRRLTSLGTTQTRFLASAFERERLATHITRFPALVADRLACNKLFRRSFWEGHELRFPEGVRNEDIPVIVPAHYLASSVDVLAETVYLWRHREGGDFSGTQRRTGAPALRDRVNAVTHVSRFLADRGLPEAKYFYECSVVGYGGTLRYFLDVLHTVDNEVQNLFLELVNGYLDQVEPGVLDEPPAIERLKWQLARRRALPELLEVLRFQAEDIREVPPVRRRRGWYGNYPYRTDRRLGIPRQVYRLDEELALVSRVSDLRWEGETLRIEGYAYIDMIGAPRRRSQRIKLVARRTDSPQQSVELHTKRAHRPDVTAEAAQQIANLDWSGFVATLDAKRLMRGESWRSARWEIGVVVRAGGVTRDSRRWQAERLHALPAAQLSVGGASIRAGLRWGGRLEVRIQRSPSLVRSYALEDGVLRLEGDLGPVRGEEPTLSVTRRDGTATLDYPVAVDRSHDRATFSARVPVDDLVGAIGMADRMAHAEQQSDGIDWDLYVVGPRRRHRVMLSATALESTWTYNGREIAVQRARDGRCRIVERAFRPVVTGAEWSPTGTLTLTGSFRGALEEYELFLRSELHGNADPVPLRRSTEDGRFTAELRPGSVSSLAGSRSLGAGRWALLARPRAGERSNVVVAAVAHELLGQLPVSTVLESKPLHFGVDGYDAPLLIIGPALSDEERGGFRQRQLRTRFYRAKRRRRLRDAVLYDCFGDREYSDNPRRIHEELVRRGAPLEHLWIVRDGARGLPETARAVRELSKDYYEAYASARYVVANDYWPRWATRRNGQTWLQTWHGAPLKRLGHSLADRPRARREYRRALSQAVANWQYVLSPGAFATPILQAAFPGAEHVVESGLPRVDALLEPERDRVAEAVRQRIGLPAGMMVVLYAPTYRDHLASWGGYLMGPLLDLARVRAGLGKDNVLLFRRHHAMIGAFPEAGDGVVDVSAFPDATELLLAVDVLVTDYSSAIFDFASLRRPIVLFAPDLETYRDEVRGFSIDLEAAAPGPLLKTTDEVVDALRDPDRVQADFRGAYDRFVAIYCPLADGHASSRAVDHVFRW